MVMKYTCAKCGKEIFITGHPLNQANCKCGGKFTMPGVQLKDIVVKK
jgi:DNA-directed RNA polymerase subunit RPC12/RpoP